MLRSSLILVLAAQAALAQTSPREALPPPKPFTPKVSDPLLAPVAPASEQLGSWSEAYGKLLAQSTDLASAEASVDRASGRWRQALSALLPNARVTASASIDALHPNSAPLVGGAAGATGLTNPLGAATATLTQSLVDPSAWKNVSSNAASDRAAKATLEDTQRRVTQGLARTLVAVFSAERAAELNRVGLRQALERAALTERTFQLGAATQLDVVRVRQDVEVARGALIAGDEQLRRAREALGLALGSDHDVGVKPDFRLAGVDVQLREACAPLSGPDERADLASAKEQRNAAKDSKESAALGYLPSLGLSTSLNGYTVNGPPLGQLGTWNIAAVLTVPIWEGGLREGLVRERRGVEKQADQSLEATRRSISIEVSRARRGVDVAGALAKNAADAHGLAEKLDELTRRSFEVGRSTSLELVQSAAALRQADLNLALREFELVQARLDALLTEARCSR